MPSGRTAVYGIIGHPVAHSLSPLMHSLFAQATGLDLVYCPFPVDPQDLPVAMRGLRALGVQGVNVTVPHKEAVRDLVDRLSPEAQAIGAVNTVVFGPREVLGHNTDAVGFARALDEAVGAAWRGPPALVLGAGGAARAIIHALGEAGCAPIFLANRTEARAHALAADFPGLPIRPVPLDSQALTPLMGAVNLVVNTTARGLHGEDHPEVALEGLAPSGIICDIVYNPLETPLLRRARSLGLRGVDGLGMLIHQGSASFALWTGVEPPLTGVKDQLSAWLQTPNPARS